MKNFVAIFLASLSSVCLAQKYIHPVFDRTDISPFHLDSVEITKDSTFLFFTYEAEAGSWANISDSTYIEDVSNKKKIFLDRCEGIPFSPEKRVFNVEEKLSVILCFPSIGNTSFFNLIEDENEEAFNIYGINLTQCYPEKHDEREYNRFKDLSDYYKSANNETKYLEYEEKELDAACYIYGIKSIYASICYKQLSDINYRLGDYSKAIKVGLQSLECDSIHWGVESLLYVRDLSNISFIYSREGNNLQAVQCLQKCISLCRKIGNEEEYIENLHILSGTAEQSYEETCKIIEFVQREIENLPDFVNPASVSIAGIQKDLAERYYIIDDNKNAIKYCDKALATLNSIDKNTSEDYAILLELKCIIQQSSGLTYEAIASGKAAKQLYESLDIRSLEYAGLLESLAWAYEKAWNYEKAIQLQTIAAGIYENAKDWISLSKAYNSISLFYYFAENLDDAERNIKKAFEILDEHDNAEQYIKDEVELTGHSMPVALASINQRINEIKSDFYSTLSKIYDRRGDLTNAINTELKRGTIIKSMGDDQSYASHLIDLSGYYRHNHQQNDAMLCIKKSVQILSKVSIDDRRYKISLTNMDLAHAKVILSLYHYETGDIEKAIQYVTESISQRTSDNNIIGEIQSRYLLSSELKSNFTKRELAIVSATEINEKVSDDVYLSTLARYQSFFAPKKVGKGLTWTSSELQSDAYVFNYERKNFDGFSLSKMKEDILSQLDKKSVHVQRLIRSNRNLIFRYTSRQTGESVDITINTEDLK